MKRWKAWKKNTTTKIEDMRFSVSKSAAYEAHHTQFVYWKNKRIFFKINCCSYAAGCYLQVIVANRCAREWRRISCVIRIWWKDDEKKRKNEKNNVLLATCSHQVFIIISLVCFYNVQKRIRTFLSVAFFALHFLALGFKFRISSISIVSCFRIHNAMTSLYASASA